MGCSTGCAKAILILFNLIFWLSGLAFIGVALWMTIDREGFQVYLELIEISADDKWISYVIYGFFGIGALIFLIGFCGCCGAVRESRCLLGLYLFFLIIILAAEVACGVLAVLFQDKLKGKLKNMAYDTIRGKKFVEDSLTQTSWDRIQEKLECCGVNGPTDYYRSVFYNTSNSKSEDDKTERLPNDTNTDQKSVFSKEAVPNSCCVQIEENGKQTPAKGCQNHVDVEFKKAKDQKFDEKKVNFKGCGQSLEDWLKSNVIIFMAVGFGIAVLELIGILCACILCCAIGREKIDY